MQAILYSLFFAPPKPSLFSNLYLFIAPFVVLGVLLLSWSHDPFDQLPTALIWSSFAIKGLAERLPSAFTLGAVWLRILAVISGSIGLMWLLL